jgi:hypothetical protein
MRRARLVLLSLLVLLLGRPTPARSQPTDLESQLRQIPRIELSVFEQFLAQLRSDLAAKRRAAVCGAIIFPLRRWSGDIADRNECVRRYDEIFTTDVVQTIAKPQSDKTIVTFEGVAFDDGKIWIVKRCGDSGCKEDLGLQTINNDRELAEISNPPAGHLFVNCQVLGTRVQVAAAGGNAYVLRTWEGKPEGKPDLAIGGGTADVEGTGACSHTIWTFHHKGVVVSVSELGCSPDSNPPAKNAVALFSVEVEHLPPTSEFCEAIPTPRR